MKKERRVEKEISRKLELESTDISDEKIAIRSLDRHCRNCGFVVPYTSDPGGDMGNPGSLIDRAEAREYRLNPDSGSAFVLDSGGGSIGATAPPDLGPDEQSEVDERRKSRIKEIKEARRPQDSAPL